LRQDTGPEIEHGGNETLFKILDDCLKLFISDLHCELFAMRLLGTLIVLVGIAIGQAQHVMQLEDEPARRSRTKINHHDHAEAS
jgi:hypothetical protein